MRNLRERIVQLKNREIRVFITTDDKNENGRAIVHYSELGLKYYIDISKHTLIKKYTGEAFGGAYIFPTYGLEYTLERTLESLQEHYSGSLGDIEIK